jgi:Raf kinase inhibitor-like YbhB/YbcL family protein
MAQKETQGRAAARPRTLSVTTDAWLPGERIPEKHTADGDNVSPPFRWGNLPEETQAVALLMEDLDAPQGPFTHWVAWNIPPELGGLPAFANVPSTGGKSGRNDFGSVGYRGPEPPAGTDHRYVLRVFALREPLRIRAEVPREEVEEAMQGRVLAEGEYVGTYSRDG